MPNIPCDQVISCPGSDNPISNWSSEAPDGKFYFGYNWGWGVGFNDPQSDESWDHNSCLGLCISYVSQEDADLCAARAQLQCMSGPVIGDDDDGGNGGGNVVVPPHTFNDGGGGDSNQQNKDIFCNDQVSAPYTCKDGSIRYYTVLAGTFCALSKSMANAMAMSFAIRKVLKFHTCITIHGVVYYGCVDSNYLDHFIATGGSAPYTWAMISGSLPDGLTLDPDGTLHGIPTTPGDTTGTIQVTDAHGFTSTQAVNMTVIGITNLPLPDAVLGTDYSTIAGSKLLAGGGSAPYTYTVNPSDLPSWLTMDDEGQLSGTPSAGDAGTATFDVTVTDALEAQCVCSVSLTVPGITVGYYICAYKQTSGTFGDVYFMERYFHTLAIPACGIDNRAGWEGVFDTLGSDSLLQPFWYFTGKSMFNSRYGGDGIPVSADQAPNYPLGPWEDVDSFTCIYWDGSKWILYIADVCGNVIWQGDGPATIADASGEYTWTNGIATIPLYIYVSPIYDLAHPDAQCITECDEFDDVDWIFNPGNCRLRVSGYHDGVWSGCLECGVAAGGEIPWTGTFPEGPLELNAAGYYQSNTGVGFVFSMPIVGDLGGARVELSALLWYTPATDLWTLGVECQSFLGPYFTATKAGKDPIGVYTTVSKLCGDAPDTVTVEAYTI